MAEWHAAKLPKPKAYGKEEWAKLKDFVPDDEEDTPADVAVRMKPERMSTSKPAAHAMAKVSSTPAASAPHTSLDSKPAARQTRSPSNSKVSQEPSTRQPRDATNTSSMPPNRDSEPAHMMTHPARMTSTRSSRSDDGDVSDDDDDDDDYDVDSNDDRGTEGDGDEDDDDDDEADESGDDKDGEDVLSPLPNHKSDAFRQSEGSELADVEWMKQRQQRRSVLTANDLPVSTHTPAPVQPRQSIMDTLKTNIQSGLSAVDLSAIDLTSFGVPMSFKLASQESEMEDVESSPEWLLRIEMMRIDNIGDDVDRPFCTFALSSDTDDVSPATSSVLVTPEDQAVFQPPEVLELPVRIFVLSRATPMILRVVYHAPSGYRQHNDREVASDSVIVEGTQGCGACCHRRPPDPTPYTYWTWPCRLPRCVN